MPENFDQHFAALRAEMAQNRAARVPSLQLWQSLFGAIAHGDRLFPDSLLLQLSRSTGFSPANLRYGLQRLFAGLAEPVQFAAIFSARQPPRIAIIAAGNIPGIAIAPAVLLATAGCPVVVKQAQADQILLPWLLESLRPRLAPAGPGIFAGYWPAESRTLSDLLAAADRLIAFGSDATIADLQRQHPDKVIGFGHKFSVGYLDTAEFDPSSARALAEDVALFEQMGCLSAQAIFVRGAKAQVTSWAEQFSRVLAQTVDALGAGFRDARTLMRRHAAREALVLGNFPVFAPEDNAWDVAVLPAFAPDYLLGRCFVQVIPIREVAAMGRQLAASRQHLQGVALAAADTPAIANDLKEMGFSYVCAPGKLQSPPLDWANGGVALREVVLHSA